MAARREEDGIICGMGTEIGPPEPFATVKQCYTVTMLFEGNATRGLNSSHGSGQLHCSLGDYRYPEEIIISTGTKRLSNHF